MDRMWQLPDGWEQAPLESFALFLKEQARLASEEYQRLQDSGAVGHVVDASAGEAFATRRILNRFLVAFPQFR